MANPKKFVLEAIASRKSKSIASTLPPTIRIFIAKRTSAHKPQKSFIERVPAKAFKPRGKINKDKYK